MLSGMSPHRGIDDAVEHIMGGFAGLQVHPDVSEGIRALAELGIRLVTLGNGSASIARRLLADAGLEDAFESCMSVEQAGVWKPAAGAYAYIASPASEWCIAPSIGAPAVTAAQLLGGLRTPRIGSPCWWRLPSR
jgi:hypothetical protein